MKTYLVTYPRSNMFILKIKSMRRAREYLRSHRHKNPDKCLILGLDERQEGEIMLQVQVEVHTVSG